MEEIGAPGTGAGRGGWWKGGGGTAGWGDRAGAGVNDTGTPGVAVGVLSGENVEGR
ncbi:MAG: hypothetical protein U0798_07700 [Gemmataceae bacterium]